MKLGIKILCFWALWLCVTSVWAGALLDTLPAASGAEQPRLPAHLPQGWRTGLVNEPVFNSRILLVEAGTGNAETVILVHGLGQNGFRDWQQVMGQLARDYHVIALDLPGFGYSDKPPGRYSPTRYAELLSWLVAQTGQQQVHMMGHSMGGAVALRYASNHPGRLQKLVLVSVAGVLERTAFVQHSSALPLYMDQVPGPVRHLVGDQWRQWGGKLLDLANRLPDPVALLSQNNSAWQSLLGDSPNGNAALALIEEDFGGTFAKVTVPTLIIWGEDDPVTPVRTGQLLAGQLPHAELMVFADTGHVPMQRLGQFNQQVSGFLSGQRSVLSGYPEITGPGDDLLCQGLSGVRYQGSYRSITINACTNVHLEHVRAQRIELINSEVSILNVQVRSENIALETTGSSVKATNSVFQGRQGIYAVNSRLDLAGVSLRGSQSAVVAGGEPSQFIFSVSEVIGADGAIPMHGSYRLDGNSSATQQ
ncbi:MAG TPA: alpha/beta hydrolase [Cellvibrionaceae bacterium]